MIHVIFLKISRAKTLMYFENKHWLIYLLLSSLEFEKYTARIPTPLVTY